MSESNSYFIADTLDDLLMEVLSDLVSCKNTVKASRGSFTEIFGAMIVLTNPRARLSRSESRGKIFSSLGEFFWYLSGKNELKFIEYYLPKIYNEESEDGITVRSGYGERLFNFNGINQVQNVINLLKEKTTSRRAVIQLFDSSDLSKNFKSIPCTCTLQFLLRDNKLNMHVNMRSNDAYFGLPHDIFTFTMLQEVIACSLGSDLGTYKHSVGSLHLYSNFLEKSNSYITEGYQNILPMNPMPQIDNWSSLQLAQKLESDIRDGNTSINLEKYKISPYWSDIIKLLLIFGISKETKTDDTVTKIRNIQSDMSVKAFDTYINCKIDSID